MNQAKTNFLLSFTKEKQAIDGIHRNDDAVLGDLYCEVFPKVRIYVLQNSGSDSQAKDIFQEAFIAFWKNVKEGKYEQRDDNSIQAYLYTIARNKWLDYLRSPEHKRVTENIENIPFQEPFEEEQKLMEEEIETEKRLDSMRGALEKLGKDCKEVLTQFYFQRMSIDIIAEGLQIGSASARNKKYRCLEKLRSLTLSNKDNE